MTIRLSRGLRILLALALVASLAGIGAACKGPSPDDVGDGDGENGEPGDGGDGDGGDGEPVETAFVRRAFSTLSQAQIDAFSQGVAAMKARPVSDPTSWLYQANIHGTTDLPLQPAWRTCQHGSFFFLSWHRMYLYYFERILRDASPDTQFALPYWDYNDTSAPERRAIPQPLRQPADPSNPLWVQQRSPTMNAGGLLPPSVVSFTNAFTFTNFCSPTGNGLSFGGQEVAAPVHGGSPHSQLEMTPHDAVHVTVGGFMGSFATAARDPVFWLHHANVDRLWKRWLDQGGGRGHAAPALWLDHAFTFFDVGGVQVTKTGQEILDTIGDLDYRYDDDPPAPAPDPPTPCAEEEEEAEPVILARSGAVTLSGGSKKTELEAQPVSEGEAEGKPLVLNLEGIEFDRTPGAIYEIYLNLPQGEEPTHESPHYVGNLVFFGLHHEEQEHGEARLTYGVDRVVEALKATGNWQEGDFDVTFVRRPPEPPPGEEIELEEEEPVPVSIKRVTISTG